MSEKKTKKLFIIGNGFDLAHKLPSGYNDFKTFLENEYSCYSDTNCFDDYNQMPEVIIGNKGDRVVINENQIVNLIYNIINESLAIEHLDSDFDYENVDWNNFEERLAYLNIYQLFDAIDFGQLDDDLDEDYKHKLYNNEDFGDSIREIHACIKRMFNKWVLSLDIDAVDKNSVFASKIDKDNDLFLTFNYTSTLEDLYGCKNVCHIHGNAKQFGYELVIGHGLDDYSVINEVLYDDIDMIDIIRYKAEEYGFESLKKDVEKQIKKHEEFFNLMIDVEEIVCLGFSYNDIDKAYINKIVRKVSPLAKWILCYYNEADYKKAKKYETDIIKKDCEVVVSNIYFPTNKELLIFANGFDIAHDLNTSWKDFKDFVEKQDYSFYNKFTALLDKDHSMNYDEIWSNLEKSLSRTDLLDIRRIEDAEREAIKQTLEAEEITNYITDNDIDIYTRYTYVDEYYEMKSILVEHLLLWITKINEVIINKEKVLNNKFLYKIMNKSNKIISFNYTDTIETLYGRNDVLHLHGRANTNDELIIGHGEILYKGYKGDLSVNDDYKLIRDFKKDTNEILKQHSDIIKTYGLMGDIYIIGWGYGKVDIPYFELIKKYCTSHDTKWHLGYYSNKDKTRAEEFARNVLGTSNYFLLPSDEIYLN